MCVSLLTALVLFIMAVDTASDWSEDACHALGLLLHYFLLQAFVWMAAEALLVYFLLVKVQKHVHRQFAWFCFAAAVCKCSFGIQYKLGRKSITTILVHCNSIYLPIYLSIYLSIYQFVHG